MSPAPGGERRFLALVLGPAQGVALARAFERALGLATGDATGQGGPRGLRRVATADLHLTLFFLGTPPEAAWRSAWEAACGAAAGHAAPELVLDRFGCFPRPGAERVLWAGVGGAGLVPLRALQAAIEAAVTGAGFEPESRPWAPHVTLARVRGARPGRPAGSGGSDRPAGSAGSRVPPALYAEPLEIPWTPGALALVRSLPASERGSGSSARAYEVQERFSLGLA